MTAKTYTKALLKSRSAHDGNLYSLYWVFILTAKPYTDALLKDKSTPNGHSTTWVLTLMANVYREALLKDNGPPDGYPYSLYRVLTLTAKAYTKTLL